MSSFKFLSIYFDSLVYNLIFIPLFCVNVLLNQVRQNYFWFIFPLSKRTYYCYWLESIILKLYCQKHDFLAFQIWVNPYGKVYWKSIFFNCFIPCTHWIYLLSKYAVVTYFRSQSLMLSGCFVASVLSVFFYSLLALSISQYQISSLFLCLLFNDISTILGYLIPNPSFFQKDNSGAI